MRHFSENTVNFQETLKICRCLGYSVRKKTFCCDVFLRRCHQCVQLVRKFLGRPQIGNNYFLSVNQMTMRMV